MQKKSPYSFNDSQIESSTQEMLESNISIFYINIPKGFTSKKNPSPVHSFDQYGNSYLLVNT